MKQVKKLVEKYKKYIMYIVVGGFTTLVNLIIYAAIRYVGMSMLISNFIAFIGAVIFAYVTNKKYVFETGATKKVDLYEFGKFLGMRVGSFGVETVLLLVGVHILPYELVLKVIIGIIVIILNYVISNKFVFSK